MHSLASQFPQEFHKLQTLALQADAERIWPGESWQLVRTMGGLQWAIPKKYGGIQASPEELLNHYEQLASVCLTSCFILSQRDAACRRILASGNETLRQELLPTWATGKQFATVGLSQLTTSRQHGQPAFTAREEGDGFHLHGTIPWVTGAQQAQHIIVGATLENETRQLLLVLPIDTPGVSVGEPLDLMALQGSMTAEVHCDHVHVPRQWLLAGPEEKVMSGSKGGAGGLQTSCLALGLASAAIDFLRKEAESREGLLAGTERLEESLVKLRNEMQQMSRGEQTPEAITNLRAQANTLVVRAGQAALIASKGSGFVRNHPAQMWVRQSLFFLVWSCPWPTASATLDYLTVGAQPSLPA